MSCERNPNKASRAAGGSGIARLGNKMAALAGKVTGLSFIRRKIRARRAAAEQRRQAEAQRRKAAAQRAAERTVARIKDPAGRRAALALQETFLEATVGRGDLEDALRANRRELIAANTWRVSGQLGQVVYEAVDGDRARLQAITPRLGREVALQSSLAAVARPPGAAEPAPAGLTDQTQAFLAANQDDAAHMARTYVPATVRAMRSARMAAFLTGKDQRFFQAAYGAQLATQAVRDVQEIQRRRAKAQRLADRIKDPARKQAAVALQQQVGAQFSRQGLQNLIGGRTRRIAGQTWQIKGKMGQLYFDDQGGGRVSLEGIRPKAGQELKLHQGLRQLQGQAEARPGPKGTR